jgi:hypothetical protein
MLLFGKLVDETQMGNPSDHAVRDIASKFSIFLPLRAIYFRSYRYETPCTYEQERHSNDFFANPFCSNLTPFLSKDFSLGIKKVNHFFRITGTFPEIYLHLELFLAQLVW